MKDVFDDDNDDDGEEELTAADIEKAAEARKARKDREEQLRKMMDEDDEPMADAPPEDAKPDPESEDIEIEDVDTTAALDAKVDVAPTKAEEETVTVSGGRRRGKRRVMKKITKTDEAGYLVTTEEATWESYSEDEPETKKPKVMPTTAGSKKKGGAPAKGQGNIMSFFGKK